MKKIVLKLDFPHDKAKQKAMKTVSGLSGVESISMDSKDKKLTVTGDIDPVHVVSKLRKLCPTDIVSVGPAKEEKKKEEPKKEEPKKDDKNKDTDKKKDNKDSKGERESELVKLYRNYNPYTTTHYNPYMTHYYVSSAEENPNSCVIS